MQEGSGGHTGAADIAGVPVDFRRYQHHVTLQSVSAVFRQSLSHFIVSKEGGIVSRCELKNEILFMLHSAAISAIMQNWKTTEDEDE
jgi:hypothetical protein